jgi:hypothetical protein
MNHESCRERLVELVYGELTGRQAREVERHLETCDACRAERDELLATRAAMHRLEAPAEPERLDPVVLAEARRAAEAREGGSFAAALRGFGAKLAAGTAVAVLLALVLMNVGRIEKGPLEMARQASQPEAERRAEAPPSATGVGPSPAPAAETPRPTGVGTSPAPAAEPRLASPPSPTSKPRAARERAAPPARARAKTAPEWAAPAAPPPAAPARAAARPGEPDESAAREAAPRARDEQPRGEPEERRLEEHELLGGRGEQSRREEQAAGGGAPAFAERPPAPAAAASRRADGAPTSRPAARAHAQGEAAVAGPEAKRAERPWAAKAASTPIARGAGPVTQVARDVERRRAAGELSEAVRRFEPCPGGDRRRAAWIDGAQHVLKLRRELADGSWVEEWFDASGRLREALVHGRAGGAPWTRRVVIGEDGARTTEDEGTAGLAPDTPPPRLVERDPSDAFFAGPGCGR